MVVHCCSRLSIIPFLFSFILWTVNKPYHNDCNRTRIHNYGFTLKLVLDMIRTYNQMHRSNIKYNKINTQTYNILKKEKTSWSCIECSKDVFSFSKLNATDFSATISGKKLKFIINRKKHNTHEEILVDRLNEALNTTNMENSSSYYNFDQFNEMFDTNVFNGFNTLHLNISSLPYNFDQL